MGSSANVMLVAQGFLVTNTLAYFAAESMTKNLIPTSGVNVIKYIFLVSHTQNR